MAHHKTRYGFATRRRFALAAAAAWALCAVAVCCAAVVCGSGAASAAESWSFETDTGGWTGLGCSVSRSDRAAKDGSMSLAVSREFPGTATILRPVSLDVRKTPSVSYHVFAPKSAGPTLKTLLFLKNKDGLWYQCVYEQPLYPGGWSRVAFDLSPSSSQVMPLGHFRRWSNTAAAEMTVIGIKFFSDRPFAGEVLVDAITLEPAELHADDPLAVVDFRPGPAKVPRFEKFELTFGVNRAFANPFDPDVVEIDAEFAGPNGRTVTVPAFYYQDFVRVDADIPLNAVVEQRQKTWRLLEDFVPVGAGCWKVRFAPVEVGVYSYTLTVVDRSSARPQTIVTRPRQFTCAGSTRPGYIRVARDRQQFEFSTGEPFYPIGHNVHSSNDVSERNCNLLGIRNSEPENDRGTMAYEDIFRKMAAHGQNLAEVWMASWSLDLEWSAEWKNYFGLGRYNLHHAWKLDRILSLAEQNGIYLHLVLENHGKLSTFVDPEWRDNPFSEENGGFLSDCMQFFTRTRAKEQYKKKLRYFIARWGYTTQIMGIELVSELDLTGNTWGDHEREDLLRSKVEWHDEMTRYIKKLDLGRHMLTTHYSGTYGRVQGEIVQIPGIDYIALDAYRTQGGIVPLFQATCQALRPYNKPVLITEYGGSPMGTSLSRLEADLHAGIWSAYMFNHAGTPLLWWFMYIDKKDKYSHYQALANFARGEDRRNRRLQSVQLTVTGPAESAQWATALALKNDQIAYLWVTDQRSAVDMPAPGSEIVLSDLEVAVPGLRRSGYNVEYWDTYTGKMLQRVPKIVETGSLVLRLPPFKNDIAVKVKPTQGIVTESVSGGTH